MILEAKCDYFDLIQIIKGRITESDGLRAILDEKIDSETALKAGLQKALSAVYNEKYVSCKPSMWMENEIILRKLYMDAKLLGEKSPGAEVAEYSFTAINNFVRRKGQADIENLAVNDLYRFLHRIGFLELSSHADNTVDNNNKKNKYYRAMEIPDAIPTSLLFRSQLEEQLVAKIENIYRIVINYLNVYSILQNVPTLSFAQFRNNPQMYAYKINLWGRDAKNALAELDPIYRGLVDVQPPPLFTRDDIEKYTAHADETIWRLANNSYLFLFSIFSDALQNKGLNVVDFENSQDLLPKLFQGESIPNQIFIRDKKYQISDVVGKILFSNDSRLRVVLIPEPMNPTLNPNEIKECDNFKTMLGTLVTYNKYQNWGGVYVAENDDNDKLERGYTFLNYFELSPEGNDTTSLEVAIRRFNVINYSDELKLPGTA